ncbi:6-phosphogluconate dehydrogenase [Microdochium trichocladiopsis]|uniref:6-phosphogluconate dehydrogenase, decarboxylating n=1 Tax=Microdochium trichocladiopsis TaxID=1682393 RepID=A0A9P8XZ52_9PEZI|nr:6-phosphogluconate dehydrogenase [Microdochium trichocladiopsis]KAH7024735.1 6-phosphogluconate dehydrogenase [Microdochium trichocladiopsis]
MPAQDVGFNKVGMLGVGSMGSAMALLMAEYDFQVFFYDPSKESMDKLDKKKSDLKMDDKVKRCSSFVDVCDKIKDKGKPRVFVLSIPHGEPADKCIEAVRSKLDKGDTFIDCGNEHWTNTERRQAQLEPKGIYYVGCGVSGGYQSARSGPSMSPGGSKEALAQVMPFLRTIAAKDKKGTPCTVEVGPGGSGHYVKMVHNGIEQGMMSIIAEVWMLFTRGLGLKHEEIGNIFAKWNKEGPLHDCFLVDIAAVIERSKNKDGRYVLDTVRDKVVQDVDEEEGTGTWTCEEAVALHVPAPTILSAHLFRCASADLAERILHRQATGSKVDMLPLNVQDKHAVIETLHKATYFCFLACFTQGMDIIRAKDKQKKWGLDFTKIMQLWRGGCIIQADHITDLITKVYKRHDHSQHDMLSSPEIGKELSANWDALKSVVIRGVQTDAFIPAISQTAEYYKYMTSTGLPTQFMEAQLDFFGEHMYDCKDDPIGGPVKGKHHFEWRPAKGITGK